ncbi:MAG: Transcription termination factor NusA [Parcubacteria group bacterium GW2011_GWA2_42_14]|nr:MAG: Transcription termination factor NusA [Parcubacteria group bacterium GW2011_GWA2_42_14]
MSHAVCHKRLATCFMSHVTKNMDLKNFKQAVQQLAEEKGISQEKVLETIEMAVAAAYKKDYGKKGQIVKAKFNPETDELSFTQIKIVVDETMIKSEEEVKAEEEERARKLAEAAGELAPEESSSAKNLKNEEELKRGKRKEDAEEEFSENPEEKKVRFNPEKHLMLEEAIKIKKDAKPEDELEFPLEPHSDFGRIASQTAKQVIIQRIREAEREAVFQEYKNKEGELVSGIVQRIEGRNVYIDLGHGIGVLPPEEQIPGERYRLGERVKAIISLVESSPKGPGIFLSRAHPRLIKKLFEIEVPEIAAGTVEIKSLAREAGSRTKVAVESKEENIDPVGSLVGQKGVRVTTVINELGGEKIDIIEWADDIAKFVANALSPAKVLEVKIFERRKEAQALVADDQLSLAIGRGGQNARLAAKLTGWRIDIRAREQTEGIKTEPETTEKSAAESEPRADGRASEEKKADKEMEPKKEKETEEKGPEEKPKEKKTKKKKTAKKSK